MSAFLKDHSGGVSKNVFSKLCIFFIYMEEDTDIDPSLYFDKCIAQIFLSLLPLK